MPTLGTQRWRQLCLSTWTMIRTSNSTKANSWFSPRSAPPSVFPISVKGPVFIQGSSHSWFFSLAAHLQACWPFRTVSWTLFFLPPRHDQPPPSHSTFSLDCRNHSPSNPVSKQQPEWAFWKANWNALLCWKHFKSFLCPHCVLGLAYQAPVHSPPHPAPFLLCSLGSSHAGLHSVFLKRAMFSPASEGLLKTTFSQKPNFQASRGPAVLRYPHCIRHFSCRASMSFWLHIYV